MTCDPQRKDIILCAAMKRSLASSSNLIQQEFRYELEGVPKKLYGFTAVLSYSRMRYVTFVKRCDTNPHTVVE